MKYIGLAQKGHLPSSTLLQGVSTFPSPVFEGVDPQIVSQPPIQPVSNFLQSNSFAHNNENHDAPIYDSSDKIEQTLDIANISLNNVI